MLRNIKKEVSENGYFILQTSLDEFINIGISLGKVQPSRKNSGFVDTITPKNHMTAHPNSLSKIHGFGAFPFHTDGAYFNLPPRYVLLRYPTALPCSTPTSILPVISVLSEQILDAMSQELWKVRGQPNSFYSTIISKHANSGERYIRYDTGCMTALKKPSKIESVLQNGIEDSNVINVSWLQDTTVIIDNWRCLHARPKLMTNEENFRELNRIMVNV